MRKKFPCEVPSCGTSQEKHSASAFQRQHIHMTIKHIIRKRLRISNESTMEATRFKNSDNLFPQRFFLLETRTNQFVD